MNSLWSFAFENGLGTLDQLRIELEINLTAKRIMIPVADKVKVDSLFILPILQEETAGDRDLRARALDHQIEDKDANASRDASWKHSKARLREGVTVDSHSAFEGICVVMACQPNSQPYEMCYYSQNVMRFFLENNMHMLLWNYRGFGRSQGTPTLEVRVG